MSKRPGERLVCDHCGAHHTKGVSPGSLCPVCEIGRVYPLEDDTSADGVPGTATE